MLFAEANFGNNPFYTSNALQVYTGLTPRLQKPWSVRRGKQFELDQVQPGEFHGEWANKDGALDPTNTSSPFTGGVLPYRGFRMSAVYPPSVNLVTADQATGGEGTPVAPGSIPASMNIASDIGGSTLTIAASATAYQGTQVIQSAMPVSAPVNFYITKVQLQPVLTATSWLTTTYTWSTYVRCTTAAINPSVAAAVKYYDLNHNYVNDFTGSTVVLTGSASAAWTRLTVTSTVPVGAAMCELAVVLKGTAPASTWTFQQDGSQFEQAATASSFVVPGKNYPVYSGLIERYPQTWEYSGTYGVAQPVCVDTMALLSQTILQEAFVMDVVATQPTWFFQLNEPSGATTFSEQGGRVSGAASIFSAALGAGVLTSGNPINAASGASGKFYGTNGPVVTVNNTATPNQGTVIDLTTAGSTIPSSGAWTRMIAFRTGQNTGAAPQFASYTSGVSPGSVGYNGNMYFGLGVVSGSNYSVGASFYNAAGTQLGVLTTPIINDNNWHLGFIQMSADGKTITAWVEAISTSVTGGSDMHSTIAVNDNIGGDAYKMDGTANYGGSAPFNGDLALYAQWNRLLSGAEIGVLNSSFKNAYNGDSTDQRYGRILGWAGYQGTSALDSGNTRSLTYANDVSGVDALTALQNVVNTEGGRHFVGKDGTVTFQNRQRYFQQGSATLTPSGPVWVFGENVASGEIPYALLAFDYDPTRISNQVAVTQTSTTIAYNANDVTSQQSYGVRNLARDSQSTNAEEVREQAFFLLSRYKDPHLRVQALKISVSANPALWPSALAFDIGQYVQINRRDQFGVRPTVTMYGFIEQITHSGDDKGVWGTDLEISPAPATAYATFTSLSMTLNTSASSGQPVITINALPDAATNPVRSQLTGGQILYISGGGNAEIVTVATGGVQDQSAGYTTAQLTMTTNLVNAYPSGSSVKESAPPNTFDSLAVFDSAQFSY
jgi:hypothetical protein